MSEKLNTFAACFIGWAFLTPAQKAELAWLAQHQKEIIQIMMLLPGKYRYEQVNAAINAAGVMPMDIYYSLAANWHTDALARFYEALGKGQQ